MSIQVESFQANASPEQQALDKLKEFIDDIPKARADTRLAGVWAVNFCQKPPLGRSTNMPDMQDELAALQLNTINQCINNLGKNIEFDFELPDQEPQVITVVQFQGFNPEDNTWNILGSSGPKIGIATIGSNQLTKQLRLAE